MHRVPEYWPRLKAVITKFDGAPWKWGESDCGHFAAACVEAVTGEDVLGTLRGAYRTRLQCAARLLGRGYRTATEAADGLLRAAGAYPIDPRAARVGDLGATAEHVMAVRLPIGFVARLESGKLAVVPVVTAWKIG